MMRRSLDINGNRLKSRSHWLVKQSVPHYYTVSLVRCFTALFCIALIPYSLLLIPPAHAGSADTCRDRTNAELAKELRLYRSYLYGKRKAKDAPIGNVRFDEVGRAWYKEGDNQWINSVAKGHAKGWEWDDDYMDEKDEHTKVIPIKGIFETKRVQTSELIPYLLQTIRALECRTAALCEVARYSEIQSGDDPVAAGLIQPIGCIEFRDEETWPECHFDYPEQSIADQVDSRPYCDEVRNQMIRREIELLKLAVEYDAGYRSLLQFAGNFDIFLREIRWPLSTTLRQAVGLFGQLDRIPCFLSSCDSAPKEIE